MNSIPTQQVISVLGLAAFIGAAWLMSANRKKIDWRLVVVGILLQFGFALSVLWTEPGHWLFDTLGKGFNALLGFVSAGSNFAFGLPPSSPDDAFPPPDLLLKSFAFTAPSSVPIIASPVSSLIPSHTPSYHRFEVVDAPRSVGPSVTVAGRRSLRPRRPVRRTAGQRGRPGPRVAARGPAGPTPQGVGAR